MSCLNLADSHKTQGDQDKRRGAFGTVTLTRCWMTKRNLWRVDRVLSDLWALKYAFKWTSLCLACLIIQLRTWFTFLYSQSLVGVRTPTSDWLTDSSVMIWVNVELTENEESGFKGQSFWARDCSLRENHPVESLLFFCWNKLVCSGLMNPHILIVSVNSDLKMSASVGVCVSVRFSQPVS